MSGPQRLAPKIEPTDPTTGALVRGVGLPPDVLVESCRRVGIAGAVFASLWVVALLVNTVGYRLLGGTLPEDMHRMWPVPGVYFSLVGVLLALGVILLAGRLRHRPLVLLDIGLVFLVLTAAVVGIWNQWVPLAHRMGPTVSWICVLVLVYPTIAPNTPRKILLGGLVAASMDPFGLVVAWFRGFAISGSPFEIFWSFFPNYVCAVLAVIPAHVIHGLGRKVRRARELGSYELLNVIGKGGMGEVYRAQHRLLARPAAIKIIRPELLGDSRAVRVIVSRFRREAEVVATLRNPHTIDLYDFGISEQGAFYIVMELLEGMDLENLVERFGPIPAERAIHLCTQACDSLAEAHARGMIHRDIKPSNIHACRMGLEVDFAKVLDFGLVKAERVANREMTQLTSPELTTGTPAFMAPELIEEDQPIDARVDVYAMGCVLYWLVTGALVFDAVSAPAMMMKHVNDEPTPPSRRSELPIPEALDETILACLAKRPDDRPRSAAALAERLTAIPMNQPWTETRAEQWWERHLTPLLEDLSSSAGQEAVPAA